MTPKERAAMQQALEACKRNQSAKAQAILEEALDEPQVDWQEEALRLGGLNAKHVGELRKLEAEQAEQEPANKALRIAEEALVYHTEQTRPIQKTDKAIIYLRNVIAQEALDMTFTLEDAMAKYPEISYWHNEFLKHNTTAEQAEQEPVAWYSDKGGFNECGEGKPLYAAPVRTKDLTDDELNALWHNTKGGWLGLLRAVIAADREKNK